jgi:hypothetical protein
MIALEVSITVSGETVVPSRGQNRVPAASSTPQLGQVSATAGSISPRSKASFAVNDLRRTVSIDRCYDRHMGLIVGLWLAVLGVLGAASLIIARKPDAKEWIGKLTPYQGWIGVISALWGAWWVLNALLHIDFVRFAPLAWMIWLATGAVMLVLGFLLGVGIMKSFVKDEAARDKADQLSARLAPYQGTLGLVAIGLGIWGVISFLVH